MFELEWKIGDKISIGWPDHGRPPESYKLVDVQIAGRVFRGRVTDGQREGGFLIIVECPDVALEQIAEDVTTIVGYKVIPSSLRCSIDSEIFRSLDYERHPNQDCIDRPYNLTVTVSEVVSKYFPDTID